MRDHCYDCVRKHLAQANILLDEAHLGYKQHRWNAVGHLAEAESESMSGDMALAVAIRKRRIVMMRSHEASYGVKIEPLIWLTSYVAGETDDLCLDPTNSKFLDCQEIIAERATIEAELAPFYARGEKLAYIAQMYPEPTLELEVESRR